MKKVTLIIATIFCLSGLNLSAQDIFLTSIPTVSSLVDNLEVDYKIKPTSGSATSAHSGDGIEKSFDDDMSTLYHSEWGNEDRFPITLTYRFTSVSAMDYLVYNPRTSGTNGNFKELEIYYTLEGGTKTLLGKYDFKGSSTPSRVEFEESLINPTSIEFKVLSGVGDNNGVGFASCAEMEFYQKNPKALNVLDIFTDFSCSEVKPDVTIEDIRQITDGFYKQLAADLYYDRYDGKEFRIQKYESYVNPTIDAARNKTSPYGRRDNPTGIFATAGESIVLFVEESDLDVYPSLFISKPKGGISGTTFALYKGLNTITAPHDGLLYIYYYTETGTEPDLKINFATGNVNGFYDKEIHDSNDWVRLLANAKFDWFDAKGEYSVLVFETEAFRSYAATNGPELVQFYDDLVYNEQVFQGLVKYEKMFGTRHHMQVVYGDNFMFASDYYTGYNNSTQNSILDYNKLAGEQSLSGFAGGPAWGPAHEVGHCNQTRPGLKWHGMTEVTNNIQSQQITRALGYPSRLYDENLGGGLNRYTKAIDGIVKVGLAHNAHDDVFCKLVPFWQIKLYMHDALGVTDFYGELYEHVRVTANSVAADGSSVDGICQLEFALMVCEKSGLDWTSFFEDWGFFTPTSFSIDDYSQKTFTVSQASIDKYKALIAAKGYPKVPEELYKIHDYNTDDYKK
ncbi:M60 family metallopeptidase [Bacteroidales bacterium OttesenSCG-928-M11]|nr:M60 family metallopeptidase [Bacteroidales bacterium OttesenSCG-928-M11]